VLRAVVGPVAVLVFKVESLEGDAASAADLLLDLDLRRLAGLAPLFTADVRTLDLTELVVPLVLFA